MAVPLADFAADVTDGVSPLEVTFTDTSGGPPSASPVMWVWDFGDGGESTEQNPVYTYTRFGTYTVQLTASNADGTDTRVRTGYITVRSPAPTATFEASPTTGTAPLAVTFTDTTEEEVISRVWDFGGGDGGGAGGTEVQGVFGAAGTCSRTLTVVNESGTSTSEVTDIVVEAPPDTDGPFELYGDESGLPKTTENEIPYEVISESYRENWVPGSGSATVTVRMKDEEVYDGLVDFVGDVRVEYTGGSLKLRRNLPERHPYNPNMFCTRAEQLDLFGNPAGDTKKGIGRSTVNGWPLPQFDRFRITYEPQMFDFATDAQVDASLDGELLRYCLRSRRTTYKELPFGLGKLKAINQNQTPVNIQPFRIVTMADITYKMVRWPISAVPRTQLDAAAGTVNAEAFDYVPGRGYRFAPGKLLAVGYDDSAQYSDATGTPVCDWLMFFRAMITFRSWNHFLINTGDAIRASMDWSGGAGGTIAGKPLYVSSDFGKLIRPGL